MNFSREAWRPIFLREPVAQRGWSLITRGLRAYLLRVAEDDGTLLKRTADPFELAKSLGVHPEELELVRGAIATLLEDGFLRWDGTGESPGWLGVDRLVNFGCEGPPTHPGPDGEPADETPEDRRRRLGRERKRRWQERNRSGERTPSSQESVPSVPESDPASVPGNAGIVTPSVLSPHSPLSGEQNKEKNRTDKRGEHSGRARERRVTGSVPLSVLGSVLACTPRSVPPERSSGRGADELYRFAAERALDVQAIARAIPGYEGLSPAEQHHALARALMGAAAERELQERAAS